MKAAVFEDIGKIEVKDVPVPKIDENGVLVRVKACAICGSDIRIFHHGNKRVKPPQILGHEIAGEVVEVGPKVTRFKPGDRVAMGGDIPCGECRYCENGMGNICHINYALGYQFPGGFAEYVALNSLAVNYGPIHKIPDNVSYDEAALAEPLACVLNGLELSNIKLGDTVVIIGAGPVGCMMIEVARHMGATKIIMVQRSRPRLEIAKKFGADVYICSSEENAVSRVLEETGDQGADVVIVANSSPEAQAEALKMAGNRARVNFFGGLPRNKSMVTMDTNIIHYREVFVHGSHGASPGHHRKALDLIGSGAIKIGRYISHRFCLDDILEGYKVAESHEGLRVVINP
ncbi:MAG TPA: alcohol dehydrogenase catalytic domain-containing protein [Thermoanaerobacterales bacterium]|nr:alcohol dehydrogenase catalytic domain-containing protein [Thermoanaerobacterales bacterium]